MVSATSATRTRLPCMVMFLPTCLNAAPLSNGGATAHYCTFTLTDGGALIVRSPGRGDDGTGRVRRLERDGRGDVVPTECAAGREHERVHPVEAGVGKLSSLGPRLPADRAGLQEGAVIGGSQGPD